MQLTVLKQNIQQILFVPVDFIAKIWLTIELIHSYKFGRTILFMFLFLTYVTGDWLAGILALVAGAIVFATASIYELTVLSLRGLWQ